MHLQIKKFDPSRMGHDRVAMLIGKRNTGKSFLTKDVMYYQRKIPVGVVMSATEEGNGFYGSWVPDMFIYHDFDKTVIETIIERQRKACKAHGHAPNCFIILDDCMYDAKFLREKCMRALFMNGRHWNIFLMITAQYCGDIPPAIRSNIDFVFVLRENIIQNRERLYKNFFGVFPSFDTFCQVMDKCTENYECLVIDNTARTNKIDECVFWYKARPRADFRMGSPKLWQYHKKHFNKKWDNDEDESAPPRPRNKPKINLVKSH